MCVVSNSRKIIMFVIESKIMHGDRVGMGTGLMWMGWGWRQLRWGWGQG